MPQTSLLTNNVVKSTLYNWGDTNFIALALVGGSASV